MIVKAEVIDAHKNSINIIKTLNNHPFYDSDSYFYEVSSKKGHYYVRVEWVVIKKILLIKGEEITELTSAIDIHKYKLQIGNEIPDNC